MPHLAGRVRSLRRALARDPPAAHEDAGWPVANVIGVQVAAEAAQGDGGGRLRGAHDYELSLRWLFE